MKLYQKLLCAISLFWACSSSSVELSQTDVRMGKISILSAEYVEVYLRNWTDSTVLIKNIKTTESYFIVQKREIEISPNDSLPILIMLDTKRMNGPFDGEIHFYTNANSRPLTLRLSGVVISTLTVSERCQYDMGGLFFDKENLDFGQISLGDTVCDTVWVYNPSDEPLSFMINSSSMLTYSPIDEVQPRDSVQLVFTFSVNDAQYLGPYSEACATNVGDEGHGGVLLVDAYIKENFSQIDAAVSPRIKVPLSRYNFGSINEGDSIQHSYLIENEGNADLIIRKVRSSCGCTAVSDKVRVISPGKSTTIDVVFRSEGRRGAQKKTIKIYSNDPKNSEVTLHLNGFVK